MTTRLRGQGYTEDLDRLLDLRVLLVGDPVAVEAERDPGWQVDACDWLAGEVLGCEDHQVSGTAVLLHHRRA